MTLEGRTHVQTHEDCQECFICFRRKLLIVCAPLSVSYTRSKNVANRKMGLCVCTEHSAKTTGEYTCTVVYQLKNCTQVNCRGKCGRGRKRSRSKGDTLRQVASLLFKRRYRNQKVKERCTVGFKRMFQVIQYKGSAVQISVTAKKKYSMEEKRCFIRQISFRNNIMGSRMTWRIHRGTF